MKTRLIPPSFYKQFFFNIHASNNYKAKVIVEKIYPKTFCSKKLVVKCCWNENLIADEVVDRHVESRSEEERGGKPGVNFINVKWAPFSYKCHFGSFFYIHVTRKKLPKWRSYEKLAHLTLMKLMTCVNFTNISQAAFACPNPKSAKRHWWLDCLMCFWDMRKSCT